MFHADTLELFILADLNSDDRRIPDIFRICCAVYLFVIAARSCAASRIVSTKD